MQYLLFLIVILTISCSSNQEQNSANGKVCEYFIPLSTEVEMDVVNLFEEYRYIPLETRDDVLMKDISEIRKIIVNKRGIYIADLDRLLVWDMGGKFISLLSHKGDDPQSYSSIFNFMVWQNGNISIANQDYIVSYSESNEFMHKRGYENLRFIRDLTYIDDSLMLVRTLEMSSGVPRFSIINYDNGKLVNSYDTINKLNRYVCIYQDYFNRHEGHIILNSYQSNEILELTKDSSKVWCKINVDNRIPPDGFWIQEDKTDMQVILEETQEGYIGHIPDYLEGKSTILLSFKGKRKELEGIALIDKETKTPKLLNNIKFDNNFRWLPSLFFAQEDGWCAMLIYPEDVLKKEEFARRFPGLNEESNPVLFIGKLR